MAQKFLGTFVENNCMDQFNALDAFIKGYSSGRPARPPREIIPKRSSWVKTLFYIFLLIVIVSSIAVWYFNISVPMSVSPEFQQFAKSTSDALREKMKDVKLDQFYK